MTAKKNPEDLLKRGRPAEYKTPEELQKKIDEYFRKGIQTRTFVCGSVNKYEVTVQIPTITGLCLYLGFESRQSFYAYGLKPEFSYTIKKARLTIEEKYEEQLQYGNTVGAIFALKNLDWTDKTDITSDGKPIQAIDSIKIIKVNLEK